MDRHTLNKDTLSVMDRWILSRMNSMIRMTDAALNDYKIPEAGKTLAKFVDDLSNWYVRRCRERFWAKGMEQDKINAYITLYTCLLNVCKCAAPMVPFITEAIYQNLVRKENAFLPLTEEEKQRKVRESIHLCDYPKASEEDVDAKLESDMEEVLDIIVLGRACRNAANRKNRQPLAAMFVKAGQSVGSYYVDIIKEELNVKEVRFTDDVRDFTSYTFKPQLRTVGPKYGKSLGAIKEYLQELDGNAAMDELNEKGELRFTAGGAEVVLTKEDLLIDVTQKEGFMSEEDYGITVVIDTNLTPELMDEGYVAEIISKIQTTRKEIGLEVMDHIRVSLTGSDKLKAVVENQVEPITTKVLADAILFDTDVKNAKEWDINGEKLRIGVEKI